MPGTSYALSDVERLTVILDDVIADWSDEDKAIMHDVFVRAGHTSAGGDDEVGGYSFSWGAEATPGQVGAPPDPCRAGLFQSFSFGISAGPTQLSPGQRSELNPQPLPP